MCAKVPCASSVTVKLTGSGLEALTMMVSIGDGIGRDHHQAIRPHQVARIDRLPSTRRAAGFLLTGPVAVILIGKLPDHPLVMSVDSESLIQASQKIVLDSGYHYSSH